MNWNKWIRQVHRWLSIAFTVAVIVTFVALWQAEPVVWVRLLRKMQCRNVADSCTWSRC